MLLVGTNDHLEDLDRQYTIAESVSVTAIAAPSSAARTRPDASTLPSDVYVLVDASWIARVEEFDLAPVGRLESPAGQSMASAPGNVGHGLVVGLEGAHIAIADPVTGDTEPVGAFDMVEGRADWENPAGPTPDLRSIAVSQAGTWFANVHVGGVWRSTDGGASWANVVVPDADVHEVVAGDDGRVVAAAAVGFGWSTDDGLTWSWTAEGLHASYCRAVALDGDTAFVSASTGPTTDDGRLYRATLGAPLAPCRGGLPASFPFNLDTGSVAARDGNVAVGTRDGRVFRSSDGGTSFEAVTERVGRVRVLRFV